MISIFSSSRRAGANGSCRWHALLAAALILLPAAAHGRSLQEVCSAKAAEAEQAGETVIQGEDGWLFLRSELRHLGAGPFWGDAAAEVSRANRADARDPLPAILDFKRQLDEQGVDLVMVPVPAKAAVYPDRLSGEFVAPQDPWPTADRDFAEVLRDSGVEVLDLGFLFAAARAGEDIPLYCRQDSHWSGRACVVAAEEVATLIRPRLRERNTVSYDKVWQDVEISGDLWRAMGEPDLPKEKVRIRKVGTQSERGVLPLEPAGDSPVVLLGDSHNLVFQAGGDMFTRGAGLADQLAAELGFPVDLVAVRGSGATPARINLYRRAQADPEYWAGKDVVVWCFSVREYTESDGWREVPIHPPSK